MSDPEYPGLKLCRKVRKLFLLYSLAMQAVGADPEQSGHLIVVSGAEVSDLAFLKTSNIYLRII